MPYTTKEKNLNSVKNSTVEVKIRVSEIGGRHEERMLARMSYRDAELLMKVVDLFADKLSDNECGSGFD